MGDQSSRRGIWEGPALKGREVRGEGPDQLDRAVRGEHLRHRKLYSWVGECIPEGHRDWREAVAPTITLSKECGLRGQTDLSFNVGQPISLSCKGLKHIICTAQTLACCARGRKFSAWKQS